MDAFPKAIIIILLIAIVLMVVLSVIPCDGISCKKSKIDFCESQDMYFKDQSIGEFRCSSPDFEIHTFEKSILKEYR